MDVSRETDAKNNLGKAARRANLAANEINARISEFRTSPVFRGALSISAYQISASHLDPKCLVPPLLHPVRPNGGFRSLLRNAYQSKLLEGIEVVGIALRRELSP